MQVRVDIDVFKTIHYEFISNIFIMLKMKCQPVLLNNS